MAARDRFGGVYADLGLTPLQRAIRTSGQFPGAGHKLSGTLANHRCVSPGNACDISHYEPNLALNLEVADLVNSKKGNA